MVSIDTQTPATIRDGEAGYRPAEGLGHIAVRRDALQARARAEAFLFTIRAVQSGVAALRARRRND